MGRTIRIQTGIAEVDEVGGGNGDAIEVNLGGKLANTGFKCCDGIGHGDQHDSPNIPLLF